MTIGELIQVLSEYPPEWEVWGTRRGSIGFIEQPGSGPGRMYGYVFTDGRPSVRYRTSR